MELTVAENKIKELLKDAMIEIIAERKDVIYDLIIEAIEDVGLANAIKDGRKNNFVDEKQIIFEELEINIVKRDSANCPD